MKTLIVDRVKVFQQLIASELNDSEIEHVFAATGSDSLATLKTEAFDCVCLALYLDDMDGIELCKKIREIPQYRYTPVVLLTSEHSLDITKRAIQSGITDIFSKNKIHELVTFIERFTRVNKPLNGRVLYIEDQRSQRELVTKMFMQRKLVVDAFDNAEDAWKAFLKNHYHLVVTDIVLAGAVSGVLLINKIRRLEGSKGDIPILAITAFDDNSRRISLYHMGITDYVTKPIIEEELVARVGNLIKNQIALEREIHFREKLSSEESLRRSMKMEAMGKLTGGIAHDYNNMLSIIMGYSDLLKRQLNGQQSELIEYVDAIEKASKNGVSLTNKLLAFTKKKASDTVVTDINRVISETEPMLEKLLTAGIKIVMNLADDLWHVCIDVNDLENALMNLAINSKHAMGEKGKLSIISKNASVEKDVADKLGVLAGDYVRLIVSDTGAGMDKETQIKIFDPFFSTKGDAGTGLGLSQVYGFVQRSKGVINVESSPGKGTVFNLYFPRDHRECSGATEKVLKIGVDNYDAKKGYSILIVDDEESLADLNAEILESAGYKTAVVHDADQALHECKQQGFDLMITDIIMPGLNGYELSEQINAIYPDMKIVVTSGYDEHVQPDKNKSKVYSRHLEKPVSRARLLEVIKEVLD